MGETLCNESRRSKKIIAYGSLIKKNDGRDKQEERLATIATLTIE